MIQAVKSVSAKESAAPVVRVGIYCRRSSARGLEASDFTSLDLQREAAEAYVRSQAANGWVALPDRFDDGGWSGGDVERPALQRLLRLVEERQVDVVLVFKLDRLSRSLSDFCHLMQLFQKQEVAFASVSENFSTTTATGRLLLHIISSFSEFERAQIRERTAAKASAARKRGKWIGGMPVVGYDIDTKGGRLVVNPFEAERVREVFAVYSEKRSLLATAAELNRRGWTTKVFESRGGHRHGGKPFDKGSVSKLLSNVIYTGRVSHKGEVFAGEHEAIVDDDTWNRVQAILRSNGKPGLSLRRNRNGAALKALAWCRPCGTAMTTSFSVKAGRRYAYYLCSKAARSGWSTCPSKSVPVAELERFVVGKISAIGRDPKLQREVAAQARSLLAAEVDRFRAEEATVRRDLKTTRAALVKRIEAASPSADSEGDEMADELRAKVEALERRVEEIAAEITAARERTVDEEEVAAALKDFDGIWTALTTDERARLLRLVLERVDYDGGEGTIDLTFRPNGFEALLARNDTDEAKENS